jgi:hypothetical protein
MRIDLLLGNLTALLIIEVLVGAFERQEGC